MQCHFILSCSCFASLISLSLKALALSGLLWVLWGVKKMTHKIFPSLPVLHFLLQRCWLHLLYKPQTTPAIVFRALTLLQLVARRLKCLFIAPPWIRNVGRLLLVDSSWDHFWKSENGGQSRHQASLLKFSKPAHICRSLFMCYLGLNCSSLTDTKLLKVTTTAGLVAPVAFGILSYLTVRLCAFLVEVGTT